jgi:inorganic pyrophosphatase
MDICVLTEKTIDHSNFFVRALPIGGFRMIDGDEADDKIIGVLESDVVYGDVRELTDVPSGLVDRLKHYFLSYKQLPGEAPRRVEIAEVYTRDDAFEVINRSIEDYRKAYGEPDSRVEELRRLLRSSEKE